MASSIQAYSYSWVRGCQPLPRQKFYLEITIIYHFSRQTAISFAFCYPKQKSKKVCGSARVRRCVEADEHGGSV